MKKLFLFLLFLLHLTNSFAQTDKLAKEVLTDIIEHRSLKKGELRIMTTILPITPKKFIPKLKQNNGVIYDYKSQFDKDSIHLTLKEREYLTTAFRKQMDSVLWKKDNFKPYKLIEHKDINTYYHQNDDNTTLQLSYPLFIRNNQIALVFFANSSHNKKENRFYLIYQLNFYKKIKGVWRSWICVQSEIADDKF